MMRDRQKAVAATEVFGHAFVGVFNNNTKVTFYEYTHC